MVSDAVEEARRVAIARAYLGSDPEVLEAVQWRPEYRALVLHVSADIRDHYTAAIVQAVRSVLDVRLELVTAQRETALARWHATEVELAELRATL